MLHHCRRCAVRHRAVQWVLCATCQLWEWVGGRSSSQAKPGRLEWISSVILQPPGPHAPGRGHKFNSLVCWSHRNLGPPLCVCVCACVWLGSYETKLILRYLIPTTTYIYIGLPQPFFYTWLKIMTYIYLFFILLQITCLRSQRLWSCLRFTSSPICFNIAAVCTSSLCWNSCATNAPRFPSEDSM